MNSTPYPTVGVPTMESLHSFDLPALLATAIDVGIVDAAGVLARTTVVTSSDNVRIRGARPTREDRAEQRRRRRNATSSMHPNPTCTRAVHELSMADPAAGGFVRSEVTVRPLRSIVELRDVALKPPATSAGRSRLTLCHACEYSDPDEAFVADMDKIRPYASQLTWLTWASLVLSGSLVTRWERRASHRGVLRLLIAEYETGPVPTDAASIDTGSADGDLVARACFETYQRLLRHKLPRTMGWGSQYYRLHDTEGSLYSWVTASSWILPSSPSAVAEDSTLGFLAVDASPAAPRRIRVDGRDMWLFQATSARIRDAARWSGGSVMTQLFWHGDWNVSAETVVEALGLLECNPSSVDYDISAATDMLRAIDAADS